MWNAAFIFEIPGLRPMLADYFGLQTSARQRCAAFKPAPDALTLVSEAELRTILARKCRVDRYPRKIGGFDTCLWLDRESGAAAGLLDRIRLALFENVGGVMAGIGQPASDDEYGFVGSGAFLYPPGGHMGWHTNDDESGYRLYITHARDAGRSFFRYLDPATDSVVTSLDDQWSARIFRTGAQDQRSLWHCVHSDTERFSLGFKIATFTEILWRGLTLEQGTSGS